MADPLDSARSKHKWGHRHAEALRADIRQAGQGEPYVIPLVEELDENTGTLHIRVGRITERPEQWGLMFGDALHNYRSALDNGWWALACAHMPAPPTEEQAKSIQFPIIKDGGIWNAGGYVPWVGLDATAFAGKLQPDPGGYAPDVIHPFSALNRFSNVDKHRHIHPTVHMLDTIQFGFAHVGAELDIDSGTLGTFHHFDSAPKMGDDVFTAPPDSILHRSDFKFEAHQTGFVALEEGKRKLLGVLDSIDSWVKFALDGFDTLLSGGTPIVNIGAPVKM